MVAQPMRVLSAVGGLLLAAGGLLAGASSAPASLRPSVPALGVASTATTLPGGVPPMRYEQGGTADQVIAVSAAGVAGSFTSLSSLSCTSPTFCLAVGSSGPSPTRWRPLIERWLGRSFNVVPSPEAWGAQLLGVACRTSAFCLAVGGSGNDAYSERWNGEGWRVLPTPSPRIVGGDLLFRVSCVSQSDCWTIGIENGGTTEARPLVEHWNGAAWSLVGTPSAPSSVLESIDCPSASSCWAVGIEDSDSGLGRPLVEHWNGRAFVLSPVPSLSAQLFSVSCGGPASCVAAGNAGGNGLFLSLTGGSWHASPQVPAAVFDATACVSSTDCFAGGGLTARFDGLAWQLGRPAAAYGGGTGASIEGISCPAPNECLAVGVAVRPGAQQSVMGQSAIADVIRP